MNSSRIKIDVFWMTRHYYLKTTARAKNSVAADPHSMPRFPEALFLRGERIKDSQGNFLLLKDVVKKGPEFAADHFGKCSGVRDT